MDTQSPRYTMGYAWDFPDNETDDSQHLYLKYRYAPMDILREKLKSPYPQVASIAKEIIGYKNPEARKERSERKEQKKREERNMRAQKNERNTIVMKLRNECLKVVDDVFKEVANDLDMYTTAGDYLIPINFFEETFRRNAAKAFQRALKKNNKPT